MVWIALVWIVVSSANVAVVISLFVGTSTVNDMYSIGLSTLPWGTPEATGHSNVVIPKSDVLNPFFLSELVLAN